MWCWLENPFATISISVNKSSLRNEKALEKNKACNQALEWLQLIDPSWIQTCPIPFLPLHFKKGVLSGGIAW